MCSNSTQPDVPLEWNARETGSVIIVCIVFLLLSYFSVLKRICCSANYHRNQAQRRLLDESNQDDPSLQVQSHGLELSVTHSLHMSMFKRSDGEEKTNMTDYAICFGEFEEGEWLKHLPHCSHVFHVSCIDSWLQSSSSCPLCRSHVHIGLNYDLEYSVTSNALLQALRGQDFPPESPASEPPNGQPIR